MDINTLVDQLAGDGEFDRILRNPLAQFGTAQRPLLFARWLPERTVEENSYREEGLRYRTVIANNGTRYSPVQIKNSVISGDFLVELGHSDIGSELKAKEYDALLKLISQAQGGVVGRGNKPTMEAIAQLTRWADATLTQPLAQKRELERAQAICDGTVTIKGDNGFEYAVELANPAGHRVTANLSDWQDPDYPIYDDILAGVEFMASKGYTISSIMTGSTIRSYLSKNNDIKSRVGKVVVNATGQIMGATGRASLDQINEMFSEDGLPPITLYDTQYHTQSDSGYFLKRTDFVMAATTGRDETIDLGDDEPLVISNTLGYTAIGRPAGQNTPGPHVEVTAHRNKPPRIEGEAWQTSFPVQTEVEGIYRIRLV